MKVINLQNNENYWLLDEEATRAYSALSSADFSTYPDYSELRERLGAYSGTAPDEVFISAGSDAAIRLVGEIACAENAPVLLPVPTFYGYEKIFRQINLPHRTVCYNEAAGVFSFPVDAAISALRKMHGGYLFLCDPNNPLGCSIPAEEMSAVLDAARDADVTSVVDEAYFEFSGTTCIERRTTQRLLVLRTLSKAFGLAGARVGYAIGDAAVRAKMEARSLPWPIAHPSTRAALAGLAMQQKMAERVGVLIAAREELSRKLQAIPGIQVFPSRTNFLFFRVQNGDRVAAALANEGIRVSRTAHMSSDANAVTLLANGIRMGIPSPEDEPRVLGALRGALDTRG